MLQIDHKETNRTPPVFNSSSPFWAEEFSIDGLTADFRELSVVVWNSFAAAKPIGKVGFSRAFLLQGTVHDEQWFALGSADKEGSVTGELHVRIEYTPPLREGLDHLFRVTSNCGVLPFPCKHLLLQLSMPLPSATKMKVLDHKAHMPCCT